MARAMRARWPITDAMRRQLVAELDRIATAPRGNLRHKLAAVKALLVADRINLECEKRDADAEVLARLQALEAAIARGDVEALCRAAGDDPAADQGQANHPHPA